MRKTYAVGDGVVEDEDGDKEEELGNLNERSSHFSIQFCYIGVAEWQNCTM